MMDLKHTITTLTIVLCCIKQTMGLHCIDNVNTFFSIADCGDIPSTCMKLNAGSRTVLTCAPIGTCDIFNEVKSEANFFLKGTKLASHFLGKLSGQSDSQNPLQEILRDYDGGDLDMKCCSRELCNNRIWFGVGLHFIVIPLAILLVILIICCCCKCIIGCCKGIFNCFCRKKKHDQQLLISLNPNVSAPSYEVLKENECP